MKKFAYFPLALLALFLLITTMSCDNSTPVGYPPWFDTYSGETLEHLKTVQDNWECFGNTIGPNVVIRGYLDTPSTPEIDYWEDEGGKHFMVTFTTRDLGALVENTDIKPFKDAVVASGFNLDADNSTSDDYLYDKDNVRINIYIVDMTDYDPHFEFVVDEP